MHFNEKQQVIKSLKTLFPSAQNVFVDLNSKSCEITVDVEEFRGAISEKLVEKGLKFEMIDYWDIYPFKYIFSYAKSGT